MTTTPLAQIVETESGIDAGYRHAPKRVAPAEPLQVNDAALKWYEIHRESQPVPAEIARLARAYVSATPLEARGMGFVLLHRCEKDFYFLIVSTWRDSNELWETVFYKDGDGMAGFAPFPRDGSHKPAFCVWELVPVWHEQQAWVRFLTSARDEAAAQSWMDDQFGGLT